MKCHRGTCRAIETTLGRRVPIADVSAYAHADDRQSAIAAGFDQYLAKPVESVALASVAGLPDIVMTEAFGPIPDPP